MKAMIYHWCCFNISFCADQVVNSSTKRSATKGSESGITPGKPKTPATEKSQLPWTEKYRPKVPNDIIGNQSVVCSAIFLVSGVETNNMQPHL